MSIQPKGEKMRNAVKWISDRKKYEDVQNVNELIQQAAVKFNMSPSETESLDRFVKNPEG